MKKIVAFLLTFGTLLAPFAGAQEVSYTPEQVFEMFDTNHNNVLDEVNLAKFKEMVEFFHVIHDADQNADGKISLDELLRVIQFYNTLGYHYCPEEDTEDGFCAGPAPGSDNTAPVVTVTGTNPSLVQCGGTYTEQGATAMDNVDGNVTATPSGSVDTTTPGAYTVTYTSTDSSSNVGSATRTVNVVDTNAPAILLNGNSSMSVNQGASFTDPGFTAIDSCEGDLHSFVVIGGQTVNTSIPGTYTITYNVSDVSGNAAAQMTRTVTVVAVGGNQMPIISAQPQPVSTSPGQSFTLAVTASDPDGDTLTYTWRHDGVNIAGATQSTYRKFGAQEATDEGMYDVVVSDGTLSVTSSPAMVSISGRPVIKFTTTEGGAGYTGVLDLNGATMDQLTGTLIQVDRPLETTDTIVQFATVFLAPLYLADERESLSQPLVLATPTASVPVTFNGTLVLDGNGASRGDVNLAEANRVFFKVVMSDGARFIINNDAIDFIVDGAPVTIGVDGNYPI